MSKDFTEIQFDAKRFQEELQHFGALLALKELVAEREMQELLKKSPHLIAYIGTTIGITGIANQVAFEFEIFGDYAADAVFGTRDKTFCFVELESAGPDAVLTTFGKKATKEWSKRLEHGFSQIVDWFCHLDDFKKTDRFRRNFGYGHVDFVGLLLIGRTRGLTEDDLRRLRWRTHNVIVDSHRVFCMTYDDLYTELTAGYLRNLAAFRVEAGIPPSPPTAT